MSADRAQPPALDPVALARLRELDPDGRLGVVQRVLKAYDESLTRMISQLSGATAPADASTVAVIAHTLKSSSASVGATSLSQACAEVEARLRAGQSADLRHDIDRLLQLAREAQHSVAAMLRS